MKTLALVALGATALLSSCTLTWSAGADGSENLNVTIIPIPVDQDSKK